MLSLNSYGVAKASNQLTLPRLSPHPPIRESNCNSVGKLAQERREVHPWYRTTTGFQYGRHVDFQDLGLNLSPLKTHCKHMEFTEGFLEGPYTDSSLSSLEMRKKRLVLSDKLRAERQVRMKQKFEEKQLQLGFKREIRRELREKRRLELQEQTEASVEIQRHIRGTLTRIRLAKIENQRKHSSAVRIQTFYRSQMRMHVAKQALQQIKDEIRAEAASVIQRQIRRTIARRKAKAELNRRRELRIQRRDAIQQGVRNAREKAAVQIQRVTRGSLVRKRMHRKKVVVDVVVPVVAPPAIRRKQQASTAGQQPQAPLKPKQSQQQNKPTKRKPPSAVHRASSTDVNAALNDA